MRGFGLSLLVLAAFAAGPASAAQAGHPKHPGGNIGTFFAVPPAAALKEVPAYFNPAEPVRIVLKALGARPGDYITIMPHGIACVHDRCDPLLFKLPAPSFLAVFSDGASYLPTAGHGETYSSKTELYRLDWASQVEEYAIPHAIRIDGALWNPRRYMLGERSIEDCSGECGFTVRVPATARELLVGASGAAYRTSNSYTYSDFRTNNAASATFGVFISRPNGPARRPDSDPTYSGGAADADEPADDGTRFLPPGSDGCVPNYRGRIVDGRLPLGTVFTPVRSPQYRGWTHPDAAKPAIWRPNRSTFGGRGGRHKGVDLFAMNGASLRAPLQACFTYNPGTPAQRRGLGNVAVLTFAVNGRPHHLVMAHVRCSPGPGANPVTCRTRRVDRGEIVANAGCTGIAAGLQACRHSHPFAGRTDHVHVELRRGRSAFGAGLTRINPVRAFGWQVRCPENGAC